jgi:surface antigen
MGKISPMTDLEEIPFIENLEIDFQFESGYFTVGESGEVTIDYLFDGGEYQGELAIFSLEGMEDLDPGSEAFIQEAANRALSESELGYIVISDKAEGARFNTLMPNETSNWNSGDYQGAKTFQMQAGDRFGFMLVPNGQVARVADHPGVTGPNTPLFSMVTANPDDTFAMGQIVDVFGDDKTFVFEDLRGGRSDADYNDLIIQVRGAAGDVIPMDFVINADEDWRTSDLGQAISAYGNAYVDWFEGDLPLPASREAQPLIGVIDTGFSANNPDIDYSRLILGKDHIAGDENPLLAPGEGDDHGTHVLGIIGATQDNGIGIDGVNDDAPLWVGRAIGSGEWADSLGEFVDEFVDSGQPNAVVNLSLDLTQVNPDGTVTTRYEFTPEERAAIELARQHNVLLVVAAGNDGGVMSALGQASQEFDNIITVGAAMGLTRADYSSYGRGLDIMAPGGSEEDGLLSTVGDGVGTMAGTSVATAQVTGAISQVWAANPGLSYRQVIDIIKQTAQDLDAPNWDAETGAGLLNMMAAIHLARATQPEAHNAPASLIPDTWSGEGVVTPLERAVRTPYTFKSGDTLWDLAVQYLGSGTRWREITKANGSSYTSAEATKILPGTVVYLPIGNSNPNPNPNPNPVPNVPINSNSGNYRNGRLNPYAWNSALIGQCTWFAYGRMLETGLLPSRAKQNSWFLSHAWKWRGNAQQAGLPITSTPTRGARGLVIWPPGVQGSHSRYGHVAFLEEVYSDGRIRISQSNWAGRKYPHERIMTPAQYSGLSFVRLENVTATQPPSYSPPAQIGQQQKYIVKSGDTLWGIAQRYLGNGNRWREIRKANGSIFTDAEARRLQVGQAVYLPVSYQTGNGRPIETPPRSTPRQPSSNINWVNFSGTVGPRIGVNLRYSPQLSNRSGRNEPYGKRLEFDAWTTGQTVTDLWLGTPDSRWFKVKGTNLWVPSAYIWGNPPSSGGENQSPVENQPDDPTSSVSYARFDQAFPYMYGEMINNKDSNTARQIKSALKQASYHLKKREETPWWNIFTREWHNGQYIYHYSKALGIWGNIVRNNQPWDHKPKLEERLDLKRSNDYYFPIREGGPHEYYYDIWSNIHYGYLGAAVGFSRNTLQFGASVGESILNGVNDNSDVVAVDIGINLWRKFGRGIKKNHLLSEIIASKNSLNRIGLVNSR